MATLTEASIMSRKGVRYIIYGIISLVVLRMLILSTISIYRKIFPPPPEAASVSFGKLTKIPLPDKPKHPLTFTLETPEGGIPQFPLLSKVYFMPKTASNLLSLDVAKDKVQRLGFNPTPQQITESVYKFYHKTSPSTLEMNIITGAFSISYELNVDPAPISVRPPQPEIGSNAIKTFLSGASLYPTDFTGDADHKYLKPQGGVFVPALSLSDANLVRIDLFRKAYDELPAVTATPKEGNVWFMVSGIRERGKEVIAGEYRYFSIDETQVSTYPIKSGDTVWQELLSGNYYPASLGTTAENDSIKIRKIYLAYYDSGTYTEFYQPVYVFEGDKDFVGYIPAVTSDYYGE